MKDSLVLVEMPDLTKFQAKGIRTGTKVRCMKENAENIFVYSKGKKRYGHRYALEDFCRLYEILPEKDATASWRRRMKGVIKALSESGLWPEIRESFEYLLSCGITLEEKREIYDLSFDWREEIPNRDERLQYYSEKYPKIVWRGETGEWMFNTGYLYERSDCHTKSMYFGKWDNARVKEEIKNRLASKSDYSTRHTVNYDVSFEYDAKRNMAWYSEEYKGFANGYYYLALNNSMALFLEKD